MKKRCIGILLSLALLIALFPMNHVRAAEPFCAAPAPFALSKAVIDDTDLTVNGTHYEGSVQFTMGYTGYENGTLAIATYNLRGLYEEMTFVSSYIGGAERVASLRVLNDKDEEIYSEEGLMGPEKHTFSVKGVSKLTVEFRSDGYDKTTFAILDAMVRPKGEVPQLAAAPCDGDYDQHRYLFQNAELLEESFSMGGFRYDKGYRMRMGYTGYDTGYTAKIGFNLHENYEKLFFEIAKVMNRANEYYTRPAFLTIEVDGETLEDYDNVLLRWNDLSLPVELDVKGVSQLIIKVESAGYDQVQWALGNIHFTAVSQPGERPEPEGIAPPAPFALCHAVVQKDPIVVSDNTYSDAIVCYTRYNGSGIGYIAEINYNLKGLYKTMTFDVGFFSGALRDAALRVSVDGKAVLEETVSATDIDRRYTVDVSGGSLVAINFTSSGYDQAEYAVGNVRVVPVSTIPEEVPAKSDETGAAMLTFSQNAQKITGPFSMGGCQYEDGFVMSMGYNGYSSGYTGILEFTLDEESEGFSFDIAKFRNRIDENYTRSASLTVKVDGEALPEYNERVMLWNDIPLHVEVDVKDASKVAIIVGSGGYEYVQWAVGNLQVKRPAPPEPEIIPATPMYRLYNPNSGEHFYTGSQEERDVLKAAGWHYEGIAWNAPTKSGEPVYRLYNPNSGDHHYTMSAQERDMLVGYGWQYEGVCWNSAPVDQLPLYRLYNPNADCGSHHYTGSTQERDNLVQVGWIYEGIGWFGMP